MGVRKQFKGKQYAIQKGYPCIHLGDASGGCVPDIMGGGNMDSDVLLAWPTADVSSCPRRWGAWDRDKFVNHAPGLFCKPCAACTG